MAVNEYGAPLDRNGYAASILQSSPCCFLCGSVEGLQRHEPWNAANRQKSKEYGMWLILCWRCHERVHREPSEATALRKVAEATARADYGWTHEEFIRRFGKSAKGEKL